MAMPREPARDIWEVNQKLQLDEYLGAGDPRWVDTEAARGQDSLNLLRKALGVDRGSGKLRAPEHGYFLFCGHRGSGKSTELRRLAHELHHDGLYSVVFADATQELDVNNLRYQDVLLHLASKLTEQLDRDKIRVDPVHLRELQDWFTERVEKTEKTKAFALEARAGAKADIGLPFLARVYAQISTALKTNTTYKDELRRTLRNHFTDFSAGFNKLIEVAECEIRRRILFVIDGTDRLSGDDAQSFFVSDVYQLQQVRGVFIYCAPVHLAYEEDNNVGQNFTSVFHLPMIKVADDNGSPRDAGYTAMRDMLHRRAVPELFDDGVADFLIEHSGGHPRGLLQLLLNAFMHAEHNRFDAPSARRAVRDMAANYRRILRPNDYRLLAAIDTGNPSASEYERVNALLYNLALLEYNDFYWRSHPVVRTTQEYAAAHSDATQSSG